MKTAYLEPSAINWYVDSAYAGDVVAAAMAGCGYRPVIGLHTIYELARTFLEVNGHARGQTLFRFVQALDPAVSPGSSALMVEEIGSRGLFGEAGPRGALVPTVPPLRAVL